MLKEDALRKLGSEIRRMRKEMGMTQEMLAEELSTDFRVISRYENGQAEMGAVMYCQLVQLYERRIKKNTLLQQIMNLSQVNRAAIETILASMESR